MADRSQYIANEYRTSIVTIDNYEGGILSGRMYNEYYREVKAFRSMMELLKMMDKMLDHMGCPLSTMEKRTFRKDSAIEKIQAGTVAPEILKGRKATFAIRVQYRSNASWQGTVQWMENNQLEYFRSVLELLLLIDSVLTEEQE